MSQGLLVFVSHSSKDADRANELVLGLEAREINCWIAPRNIPAGAAYDDAIIEALANCQALVVLISEHSIQSRHVRSEVSRAASDGKKIIPIRLVDIEIQGGLKFFLELSQYVDLFADSGSEILDGVADALKDSSTTRKLPVRRRARYSSPSFVVAASAATLTAFLVGYFYWADLKRVAAEEEAARIENLVQSLQVYPNFALHEGSVVLQSWSLDGDQSSNWKDVSAHWLINGKDVVPFPFATPREIVLADAASFSTVLLELNIPGVAEPVIRDFSFEVKKLIVDEIKSISESFAMLSAFFNCGEFGCYFKPHLLNLCSSTIKTVSIGPVFLNGQKDATTEILSLDFCKNFKKESITWQMDNICVPESASRSFKYGTALSPKLNVTLIDGSTASVAPMDAGSIPPPCAETL